MKLRTRQEIEEHERSSFASYAIRSSESKGRLFPEDEHPYRTAIQRDRDRILHSRAFRRLEYKTQVFIYHEGDHYRNRLTHTLEASQIARTIARVLALNEDLAEAIVLAHDLGHTPFGHAGERALDDLMQGFGGFDHNRQSLRIVDWLEERSPLFRGLNLTAESREGILKHGCSWEHPQPLPKEWPQPSLEAQVADLADEIAYTNHDLDDGIRSGLLTMPELETLSLWQQALHTLPAVKQGISEQVLRTQIIIRLMNCIVTDLLENSAANIEAAVVTSVEMARCCKEPLVSLSGSMEKDLLELKSYLTENLYYHPRVASANTEAERVIGDLFRHFAVDACHLPERVRKRSEEDGLQRAVADYIAGMTDRFAYAEHQRIGGAHVSS